MLDDKTNQPSKLTTKQWCIPLVKGKISIDDGPVFDDIGDNISESFKCKAEIIDQTKCFR